jgi:hypothetical protein
LSPISANPTTTADTKKASTGLSPGSGGDEPLARHPPPNPDAECRCQRSRQAIPTVRAMARRPSVLTQTPR